jgi:hypothetical protein
MDTKAGKFGIAETGLVGGGVGGLLCLEEPRGQPVRRLAPVRSGIESHNVAPWLANLAANFGQQIDRDPRRAVERVVQSVEAQAAVERAGHAGGAAELEGVVEGSDAPGGRGIRTDEHVGPAVGEIADSRRKCVGRSWRADGGPRSGRQEASILQGLASQAPIVAGQPVQSVPPLPTPE